MDNINPLIEQKITRAVVPELINAFLANSGMPYIYVKKQIVTSHGRGEKILKRVTLDFLTGGISRPFFETRVIETPDRKSKVEIKTEYTKLGYRDEINKKSIEKLLGAEIEVARHWYHSEKVMEARNGISFFLDSKQKWPYWIVLGTKNELQPLPDSSFSLNGTSENDVLSLEQDLVGIHEKKNLDLFPCYVIRFQQDLIKISSNRLHIHEGQEVVALSFKQGNMGSFYLQVPELKVNYKFWNREKALIADNVVDLDKAILRNGIFLKSNLQPNEGNKEIYNAEIYLIAGDTVVDYSSGGYIRGINLQMQVL